MISEPCYWVLRCDNQFVVATDAAGGKVFPRGSTSDFGSDGTPLLIGTWQDLPCYAYELDPTPNPSLPGELTLLRPLYGLAGAEAFALGSVRIVKKLTPFLHLPDFRERGSLDMRIAHGDLPSMR